MGTKLLDDVEFRDRQPPGCATQHESYIAVSAVDGMGEYFMAAAIQQLSEIERCSHLNPDAQTSDRCRFVHRRYSRLDVGEIGSICRIADCKEMRFRGVFRNAINVAAVIELIVSMITTTMPEVLLAHTVFRLSLILPYRAEACCHPGFGWEFHKGRPQPLHIERCRHRG